MRYLILVALLLAGCSTPRSQFDAAWPKLRGQPIDYLVERWGPPERIENPIVTRAIEKDPRPVYIWNSSSSYIWNNRQTSTGTIGTTPITITTNTPEPETLYCNVRVQIDEQMRIIGYRFTGANGPCSKFSDRL